MLRFTDNMLGNRSLEESIGFRPREEEYMRTFFLDRVKEESILSGQAFMYLHYADMIANGYQRTMPCPFKSQGLLLNSNGALFYCENSQEIGNVRETPAGDLYLPARQPGPPRQLRRDDLQDVPEPVPGQRRRDEAGRALREVPPPRRQGEARPGTSSRDAAVDAGRQVK